MSPGSSRGSRELLTFILKFCPVDAFPGDGKVVKAVTVGSSSGAMEEIILEELDVFQVRVVCVCS